MKSFGEYTLELQTAAVRDLSRSTIYMRSERGLFPRPVSLGARAVGGIESEVHEWIRQRIEESRDGAG